MLGCKGHIWATIRTISEYTKYQEHNIKGHICNGVKNEHLNQPSHQVSVLTYYIEIKLPESDVSVSEIGENRNLSISST